MEFGLIRQAKYKNIDRYHSKVPSANRPEFLQNIYLANCHLLIANIDISILYKLSGLDC